MTERTDYVRATTQERHPWRAAIRTFLQAWLPTLALVVVAVPEAIAAIDAEAGAHLPEQLRVWLAGIATGAAVLAALAARIMALQSVTRVLESVRGLGWLAPRPPGGDDTQARVDAEVAAYRDRHDGR